jgi:hypothetical protein
MVSIIEVIEIIGGFIGILAIVIVIWDHFKDDRQLTKEVQDYYEHLENFLASFVKLAQTKEDNEAKSMALAEFNYYKSVVKDRFVDFSKYLGLTLGKSHDNRYKNDDSYITKSGHVLVENGNLLLRDSKMGNYERHAIGNATILRKSEIPKIDMFFSDLKGHWQKFYHKSIFRPKLKKRVNFNDFVKRDD